MSAFPDKTVTYWSKDIVMRARPHATENGRGKQSQSERWSKADLAVSLLPSITFSLPAPRFVELQ